jgi:hypothetical protein
LRVAAPSEKTEKLEKVEPKKPEIAAPRVPAFG